MTIHRYLDVLGQGGNHSTWWLFKALVDAGWTVPASGSGNGGLYATSNVFNMSQTPKHGSAVDPNGIGVGSEPWGHGGCWFVAQDPSGNRQIELDRGTGAGSGYDGWWYFRYSRGARFGEGQTPGTDWDENTPAAAPDAEIEWNGSNLFTATEIATRTFVAADDTPSPEGEYGFIVMEFEPTNFFAGLIISDDLRYCPVGQKESLAVWACNSNNLNTGNLFGAATSPGSLSYRDTPLEYYAHNAYYCAWYGYSRYAVPNGGQVSPDGNEYALPVPVVSNGYPNYIGFSRWFRAPSIDHNYPDTGGSELYLFTESVLVVDLLDGLTTPTPI